MDCTCSTHVVVRISPRAAHQQNIANPNAPRRSRRTASAQLLVDTDHTHSTDITIEVADNAPESPKSIQVSKHHAAQEPVPQPPTLPSGLDLESPLSPPSASSTPSQSAVFTGSAVAPSRNRSATLASPLRSTLDPDATDEQKPSSIGPQRVRSATVSSPSTSTAAGLGGSSRANLQKRKRSRVTPEQLAHLERVFAQDRSPTAARRKEISEQLGMQERQTQIWFQNRFVSSILWLGPADLRLVQASQGKVGRVQGPLRSPRLAWLWSGHSPRYAARA